MTRGELWLAFVLMGVVTISLRTSLLLLQDRIALPKPVERALRYVPAAVLAAIVGPALLEADGEPVFGIAWFDTGILAGLVAGAVAWRTRNILATIVVGMASLWLFTYLAG